MSGTQSIAGAPSPPGARARLGLAIVVTLAVVCVQLFYAAFMVPKIAGILQDMLGPTRLPWLTVFVLRHSWGLAVFWGALAILAACVFRPRVFLIFAFALIVVQVGISTTALTLPLIGVVKTLREPHGVTPPPSMSRTLPERADLEEPAAARSK